MNEATLELNQKKFIDSEIMSMTRLATLQRNKIYSFDKEVSDQEKSDFKSKFYQGIECELESLRKGYISEVSEEKHEKNIIHLSNTISQQFGDCLEGKRFRIGTAQKALNLFLKYLWCLKKVHKPPHFPIDQIMLKKIPKYSNIRWTKLDCIEKYSAIIKEANMIAEGQSLSLAQWELHEYNER